MAHDRRGRRRKTWTGERGLDLGEIHRPTKPVRQGIRRNPHQDTAAELPLSDRHREVLALLGEEPQGATRLSRRAGLGLQSTVSALYVLQSRGLAERLPNCRGWQLTR